MNLKYEQPDMEKIEKEYKELLAKLQEASSVTDQLSIIEKINERRDSFFSMYWLSYINYLLDVNSEYWNEQESFFAKNNPIIDQLKLEYYKVLNQSPFKEELKKELGDKVFKIAACEVSLISDEILEDLRKEKELSNSYKKLISSSRVTFDDKELTLSQLDKYLQSSDRNTRVLASQTRYTFMQSIEKQIDVILDELIKVRTQMAKKLGYESYTEVGYIKMRRIGYHKEDVATFRNQVVQYIVPFMKKIKEMQRKELNLDKLLYFDEAVLFKDGNAIPKGDTKWIVEQATEMYKKISPRLYSLFKMMIDQNLMDLEGRPGKSSGGITTYIPKDKVPIFISSFKGTNYDIQVLTHEFGHSFQLYSSRNLKYYENWWPTFDACEIHSTSMELLTLPYMDMFFGEDKDKYIYEELVTLLRTMCYGCVVDEFQHVLYDEYTLSIEERKSRWRELEKRYMPWLDFADNNYLEQGNTWQKQSHIFINPFYTIDYVLANSIALQFYIMSLSNSETWDRYIDFCSKGGTYSFVESIEKVGLKSPFQKDTLNDIMEKMEDILFKDKFQS